MTTIPPLTVTLVETAWHVTRPDGYRLVYQQVDPARVGIWKAEISAYAQDQWLTTATIDVLNLRDREAFQIAAASVNGQTPVMWEQFVQQGYRGIQDAIAHQAAQARKVPRTPVPSLAPPLPQKAIFAPTARDGAAPWLEAYISHSATWSPRAASHFHAGIGLWMLSTVAARRIGLELGHMVYPSLFIAMIARSTLYAKTTTAKIGKQGLRHARLGALLASDRSTPQALRRSMAAVVPESFAAWDLHEQLAFADRVAFAGQRGWYYEEWGGMLHQMTRKESPMAEFHALLREIDDGEDHFESDTIVRGTERGTNPYLALLCSATPHDLSQFMRPGAPYWHDGFWPRFAFLCPLADELPSRRRQPIGIASLPSALTLHLQAWHARLGVPKAHIEEICKNDKGTGRYKAVVDALPCQTLTMSQPVLEAYYTYNEALGAMSAQGAIAEDLDACYGRFHNKALRIAMLLASVAGRDHIDLAHWAYAQDVTESWRRMLHQLVDVADNNLSPTREEMLEAKIVRGLDRFGPMSGREINQHTRGYSSREINSAIEAMTKAERLGMTPQGKTRLYALPVESPDATPREETEREETNSEDVPF